MPYAVEADLNLDANRLIELTENPAAIGIKDAVLIAQLEAEAEGIVNAYLAGSVPGVPFTGTIPPVIKFITATIWARRIYRHREVMAVPANLSDDYLMAMQMLADIAAGNLSLTPITPNLSGVPEVQSSCPRGWTPRDLVTG